jgi:hypothetical protein
MAGPFRKNTCPAEFAVLARAEVDMEVGMAEVV